jgi:hypothetical protein
MLGVQDVLQEELRFSHREFLALLLVEVEEDLWM